MSNHTNVSRAPLNVLGCQWPGVDVPVFPKSASAYLMGKKASHKGNAESTSFQEAMDLKLENDRRLHELREQGKHCILNREEQNPNVDGAASLLARFHNMPWINHPGNRLSQSGTGSSQADRPVDICQEKNLVPVKHNESEEYFPGTRQQKKTRRPKNTRPKCQTIQLEELPPDPMEKIRPAGFVNAWAGRKGSELFDSRKLSLTLYGPQDEDSLVQRALQESMITLYQEQDRIVNMYSSSHDKQSLEQGSAASELPRDEAKAYEAKVPAASGAGDGSWVRNDISSKRAGYATKTESQDFGNKRFMEAGDRFDRNGSQENYRNEKAGNATKTESQDFGNKKFMEAGDRFDRNGSQENYRNEKEKINQNKYSYNKSQSGKYVEESFKRSVKEECQEANLESLGFNKSRAGEYARRETTRKREDRGANGGNERSGKLKLQDPASSGRYPGQRLPSNARDRHVKFTSPVVQNPRNGRYGTELTIECDEDPWLEEPDKAEKPSDTPVCLIAHIQSYDSECEKRLCFKPDDSSVQQMNNSVEPRSSSVTEISKTEVTKKSLEFSGPKEASLPEVPLEVSKEEIVSVEPAQNCISPKRVCASPGTESSTGHLQVSSAVEVSIVGEAQDKDEQMKKMQEELVFLNSRVEQLTSALGQTSLEGGPDPKTEPLAFRENKVAPTAQVSPAPLVSPVNTALSKEEARSADMSPFNPWFQPHLVQAYPLGHPFACPVGGPTGGSLALQPQPQPSGLAQAKCEDAHQMRPQEHALAQGLGLMQAGSFPVALQHYPQGALGFPQILVQPQSQVPGGLQAQSHTPAGVQAQSHASAGPQAQSVPAGPHAQSHVSAGSQTQSHVPACLQAQSYAPAGPQVQSHAPASPQAQSQAALLQAQEITGHQTGEHTSRSVYPEPLLAHMQMMQLAGVVSGMHPGVQRLPSPFVPPTAGVPGWPAAAPGKISPNYQMNMSPAASAEASNATNYPPNAATPLNAATASHANAGCVRVENPVEGREVPAAHSGPLSVTADSLPGNQFPVMPNATTQSCTTTVTNASSGAAVPVHMQWFEQLKVLQKHQLQMQQQFQQQFQQQLQQQKQQMASAGVQNPVCSSTSAGPSGAVANGPADWVAHMQVLQQQQQQQMASAAVQNPACSSTSAGPSGPVANGPADWVAHMQVLQQQQQQLQQQRMMQLAGVVPGMHPVLPVQRLPSPFVLPTAGVPGVSWPAAAAAPPGKIPPDYQGDWIISPADESRLAQGLPLVPSENLGRVNSSPGKTNVPDPAQFSDAVVSPTGAGQALGTGDAGPVKLPHLPAVLQDLKQVAAHSQVNVNPGVAIAENTFNIPRSTTQLAEPVGLQRRLQGPGEPRGRGRLRS